MYIFLLEDSKIGYLCDEVIFFFFVYLSIVTTRNHLSQHLAKAIQTNWNPPIGKNNMVKKTHKKNQNNHKTGGKLYLIIGN